MDPLWLLGWLLFGASVALAIMLMACALPIAVFLLALGVDMATEQLSGIRDKWRAWRARK